MGRFIYQHTLLAHLQCKSHLFYQYYNYKKIFIFSCKIFQMKIINDLNEKVSNTSTRLIYYDLKLSKS